MRLLGRSVAVVLGLWLAALLFAGLGVGPLANIPFAHIFRPVSAPPALPTVLRPKPATPADLKPALPAAEPRGGAPANRSATSVPPATAPSTTSPTKRPRTARPKTNPGKGTPPATSAPGNGTTKPSPASPTGQTHGKGHTKTTTTTTPTATTPGRSLTAPGQLRLPPPTSGR
jgi:hypothetical protein